MSHSGVSKLGDFKTCRHRRKLSPPTIKVGIAADVTGPARRWGRRLPARLHDYPAAESQRYM
jgi:hypothetical protein